jgi:hypothetical protein
MVNLRPTRKAKTSPVEGRGLGDVTETATADWVSSLGETYDGSYKLFLEHAMSSAVPTTFTSTTTGAGSSYVPYKSGTYPSTVGTAAGIGKYYLSTLGELERRISRDDMVALVDRLVKERYPAYVPIDRH